MSILLTKEIYFMKLGHGDTLVIADGAWLLQVGSLLPQQPVMLHQMIKILITVSLASV